MYENISTNLSQSDRIVDIQPVGVSYRSSYKPGQVVGEEKFMSLPFSCTRLQGTVGAY